MTTNSSSVVLEGLNRAVNKNLLGMNFIRYPVAGTNPLGVVPWQSLRVCQMHEARWSAIETSPGVYSAAALAALDSIITFQRQNNADVYFGVYCTPVFYASSSPNPIYGDDVTKGPFGITGEGAHPTSLVALGNFVTMIINRYNKTGGAWFDVNGEALGKGISAWECWNEPYGTGTNENVTGIGGASNRFYWGTMPQLVDLHKTQYDAVKAADQSIVVSTAGFDRRQSAIDFATAIGQSTGAIGKNTCDVFAYHTYKKMAAFSGYKTLKDNIVMGELGAADARRISDRYYGGIDIWCSEWGFEASVTATLTDWLAEPSSVRYEWLMRWLMISAAYGVKRAYPWLWGGTFAGDYATDTLGVIKAYNDFLTLVVGKTIIGAEIASSFVKLTFSDASTLTI